MKNNLNTYKYLLRLYAFSHPPLTIGNLFTFFSRDNITYNVIQNSFKGPLLSQF